MRNQWEQQVDGSYIKRSVKGTARHLCKIMLDHQGTGIGLSGRKYNKRFRYGIIEENGDWIAYDWAASVPLAKQIMKNAGY